MCLAKDTSSWHAKPSAKTLKLESLAASGHQRRTRAAGLWIISQLPILRVQQKLMKGKYNAALRVEHKLAISKTSHTCTCTTVCVTCHPCLLSPSPTAPSSPRKMHHCAEARSCPSKLLPTGSSARLVQKSNLLVAEPYQSLMARRSSPMVSMTFLYQGGRW